MGLKPARRMKQAITALFALPLFLLLAQPEARAELAETEALDMLEAALAVALVAENKVNVYGDESQKENAAQTVEAIVLAFSRVAEDMDCLPFVAVYWGRHLELYAAAILAQEFESVKEGMPEVLKDRFEAEAAAIRHCQGRRPPHPILWLQAQKADPKPLPEPSAGPKRIRVK